MGEQAVFVLLFAWFCISVAYPVKRSSDGTHVRKGTNTESVGKGSIGRMGLPENKILTPGKNSLKIKLLETLHLAGSNPVGGMVMPSQNDLGLDKSFSQSTQISEPRATINNKRRHDFDDWDSWESSDEHSHNRENEIRRDHSDWDSWELDSDEFQTKEKSEKNYDMRGSWTDRDDWNDWDSDISSEEKDNRGKLKIRKLWSNKGKKGAVDGWDDDWEDDWDSERSSEEIDYRRKPKIRKIWSNNGKKGAVDDWDDWDSDISSEETDDRRKLQIRKIWSNNVKKGTADDWDDDWDSDRSSEEIDYRRKLKIRPIWSNNGKKGTFHDQDDWDSEFSDEKKDSSYNHRNSRTNNGLKRNINYQSDSSDWFDDWSDERFEHNNGNIRKPNIIFFPSRKGYSDDWTSEQNKRTYRKVGRYNNSIFNDNNWSDRSDENDKDNLYIESDENDLWDNIRDDHNEIRSKNNRRDNIKDQFLKRVKNAFSSDLDDINFSSMPMMSKTMLPKGIKFLGSDNGDT